MDNLENVDIENEDNERKLYIKKMEALSVILSDFRYYKLRDNRPYINFDFESGYDDIDYNKSKIVIQKTMCDISLRNVKKIFETLCPEYDGEFCVRTIFYDSNSEDGKIGHQFLLDRLQDVPYKDCSMISGTCRYDTLLEIIEAQFFSDYSGLFSDYSEYKKNVVFGNLLIEIPFLKLYFNVYDTRGGILVSEDNNKEILKEIVSKTEGIDKQLLNKYWLKDMVTKVFDYSEEEFNEKYISFTKSVPLDGSN